MSACLSLLLKTFFSHCWMGAVKAADHHHRWKNLQLQPHRLACDIIHHHRGPHRSGEPELQLHVHVGHVFLFIPHILYLYLEVRKMKTRCGWDGWVAYRRHEIEMEEVQQQGNGPVPILHHTHMHRQSGACMQHSMRFQGCVDVRVCVQKC